MPKCPKCNEPIDSLTHKDVWKEFRYTKLYVDDSNKFDENPIDDYSEGIEENFSCPKCGEILFYIEEDAKKFLKSEWSVS